MPGEEDSNSENEEEEEEGKRTDSPRSSSVDRAGAAAKTMDEFLAHKAEVKLVDSDEETSPKKVTAKVTAKTKSKPPRPPQSVPPPYASIASLHQPTQVSNSSQHIGIRMGTPPRPAGNPGTQFDSNFATANWDDDEADSKIIESKISEASASKNALVGSNVRADPNWLDEDFDN